MTHKLSLRAPRALGALLALLCFGAASTATATADAAGWEGWSGLGPAPLLQARLEPAAPEPATGPAPRSIVDGISDQNMASWYGTPFGSAVFRADWSSGTSPRIRFARYVVPWQAGASPANGYRSGFDAWREAAGAAGLVTDLAITTYTGTVPSAARYREAVASLLAGHGVRYLEAWNEPNHVPRLRAEPGLAPEYMREAAAYCARSGCTAIAGDFLDEPGSAGFAREYRSRLAALGVGALIWGIHPYEDVNGVNAGAADPEAEADAIAAQMATGQELWITEAGAYYCFGSRFHWSAAVAEGMQRAAAARLVGTVAPRLGAQHVFYYGLFAGRGRSLCPTEDTDLYDGSEGMRPAGIAVLGPPEG